MLRTKDVLELIPELTHRQITYWVSLGLLPDARAKDSGSRTEYTEADLRAIKALVHVSSAFGGLPINKELTYSIINAAVERHCKVVHNRVCIRWPID